jgi:serine protease inhibitor
MKTIPLISIFTVTAFIFFHCEDQFILPEKDNAQTITITEQKVASSSGIFGFNLFRNINSSQRDSNIFISPLSISMALGMALNGAKGTTYDSMKAVLELNGLTEEEINQSYKSLINRLTSLDQNVKFNIANSIWYLNSMTFDDEFINTNKNYFNAEVRGLDFGSPSSVDIINGWVNQNTNGKIDEILASIPRDAVMYLINAVYFKANWKYQFDKELTKDEYFIAEDGTNLPCKMMIQAGNFNYFSNDLFQAVDLPYGDSLFSMTIILPNPGKNLEEVINQFDQENWDEWENSFKIKEGKIWLPKFEIEYNLKLNHILTSMGMGIAFSGGADFTKIYSPGGIFISEVMHKTYIKVDEEGTEAAAVTSVEYSRSIHSGFQLKFNRPFIYIIRERNSNTILFMGKLAEPVL